MKQRSSSHNHCDIIYDEICGLSSNVKLIALQSKAISITDDVRVVLQ